MQTEKTEMLKKRIIPCLDIRDGRTVKGVNFENIRDAGDAVELARLYAAQGADELVFLDITATIEKRKTLARLVERVAAEVNIPFMVGGGIATVEDVGLLLRAGADKVSINSAAVKNPELIRRLADAFGSQCVVLAIDTDYVDGAWRVFTHGGRKRTSLETLDWAGQAQRLGAGEILLTAIPNDGARQGFAVELTAAVRGRLSIPVIASGGAGTMAHFLDIFERGRADAALAASIFHFGEIGIPALKQYLKEKKVAIR